MNKYTLLPIILLMISGSSIAQVTAYVNARLIPVHGNEIERGALLVNNGKIIAVGALENINIPTDATLVDLAGKVVMPGLVDTHSHLGNFDGGDRSAPTHPDVRVLDTIDPMSDTFKKARAGGLTTINVMPGSGHLMSGQTVYLKMREGRVITDMLFCEDEVNDICGGMKMANGTNSIGETPFPGTRAKSAAIVRQLFVKALDYKKKKEMAKDDLSKSPPTDLKMEGLLEVLSGKRMVHFHTHRADDIMTILRLKAEFGFRVVLHHVSEGWKVADEIAAAKVPASIIIVDSPGGKLEAMNMIMETGGMMEKAGVDVAFHTDDAITDSRLFFRSAALAVKHGMSRDKALEALTLAGARMLDLQDRIGSLEPGKDADFIVLSGDPLSTYTKVEQTWVEGVKVFDRSNPDHLKYATGGYQVFRGDYFDHYSSGHEGGQQ